MHTKNVGYITDFLNGVEFNDDDCSLENYDTSIVEWNDITLRTTDDILKLLGFRTEIINSLETQIKKYFPHWIYHDVSEQYKSAINKPITGL